MEEQVEVEQVEEVDFIRADTRQPTLEQISFLRYFVDYCRVC